VGGWRATTVDIDFVRGAPANPSFPATSSREAASANTASSLHSFALEAGTHADVSATILYDSFGSGLSLDLSSYSAIQFLAVANDHDTYWILTLSDGVDSWTEQVLKSGGFTGNVAISLAPFAASGVDLTTIDSLAVGIDPQQFGGDATFDALVAVPEPNAGLALAAMCGLGVFVRRVRATWEH
jgi:hypothetical protein